MNARDDRADLRQRLYANGFTPLPNKNKMCLLPGWSTIDITPEIIAGWSGRKAPEQRFKDTGLRCGDIVALDWDIDDKDLLNQLLDEVVENGIVDESPFVRIGRPPRELWVYRTRDKIGKRTTGHFKTPEMAEDDNGYAVEVLGKGCQFAAYGMRDGRTEYTWPVQSLLDVRYMDLPEITLAQADAVKDYASAFFERNGLLRKSPAGGTDAGYTHVYDLEPDTELDVKDLGVLTVAEITEILHANPDEVLRAKADTFRPTSGSWACMVSLVAGALCVSDHGTYTSHFTVEADTQKGAADLGKLLADRLKTAGKTTVKDEKLAMEMARLPFDPAGDLDENLQIALERYVYVEYSNVVCDLLDTAVMMTMEHFRTLMAKFYKDEVQTGGGRKVVRLPDLWLQHKDRRDVKTVSLRPDRPYPLFREDGSIHLNTYRPLVLPAGGDPQPGYDFLERLLPIPEERKYVTQWLGCKLLNPAIRGPGIIMVAHESYGTGRGTLFEMLFRMFAPNMVRKVDFNTLAGKTYQSQYNDWLVDSLMVLVDEAQETTGTLSRWQTRNNAYERLKEVVDPGMSRINVVRKGLRNGPGVSYASIIVATNHMDSVVMPVGDRRFFICENGAQQPVEYWAELHAWMDDERNIGAFVESLKLTDLAGYDPFQAPPMTAAKADMIDAGASELDKLLDRVFRDLPPNTLLCKEQIVIKIEDALAESSIDVPDDWERIVDRMFLRATRKPPGDAPDRVAIDGKLRIIRMRGRVPPEVFTSEQSVVDSVLSTGPVVRPIRSTGKVVAFPAR